MIDNIRRIPVTLKDKSYEVVIAVNGLHLIGEELFKLGVQQGSKVLVVSNPDVYQHYGDIFLRELKKSGFEPSLLVIEAGEDKKNIQTINQIHDAAYKSRLERGSLMIALGGGVVGDMTGFAASTWLRGISVVQVPTTLLAMVDAAIGGKTGVNHIGGKNLIGTFHQPKLVLIDPLTLNTLPPREFKAGMAEVIKYGVICDARLFEILENTNKLSDFAQLEPDFLQDILYRSALSKAKVVVSDEREGGVRAILNYGHTFGHVIENLCGYGTYLHGEAVAIGMVAAGQLSLDKAKWSKEENERQKLLITKCGLPIKWPALDFKDVINALRSDKKVKDSTVRFVIPTEIGSVQINDQISNLDIENCLSKVT